MPSVLGWHKNHANAIFLSLAGVIDEDYRGNVGVVLFNFGKEKFEGTLTIYNPINAASFQLGVSKQHVLTPLRQDIGVVSIKYQ